MNSKADTYILFELAGTTYGLPTSVVQHIEMLEHVTPVPSAAAFVEGVVFSRGQVVPVVNLRARFGLPVQPHTSRTRLIVIRVEQRLVGLVVDEAREFRALAAEAIQPVEPAVARISGNCLEATATIDQHLILLPSLAAILNPDVSLTSASDAQPSS